MPAPVKNQIPVSYVITLRSERGNLVPNYDGSVAHTPSNRYDANLGRNTMRIKSVTGKSNSPLQWQASS
jgi:hypothetical protein